MRYFGFVFPLSVALATIPAVPAAAQAPAVADRVDRLEQEMRAVQRKIFPDGAGRYLAPEVTTPTTTPTIGSPASSVVTDLQTRVSALEAQVRALTGQMETSNYKMRQLEQQINQLKLSLTPPAEPASGLVSDAVGGATGAIAAPPKLAVAPPPPTSKPAATPASKPAATTVPTPAKPAATATAPAKATPAASADRKAAVAAIEHPSTGDAASDAYNYGFRLWEAKFYPEAQEQLKATVEKYGTTSFASRARNLLGRAYLDDGKPALASVAFYENYKKDPKGDRAPDSLAYLGEALLQLKKPADACKVYQEMTDMYGTNLKSNLRDMMDKGRIRAKCGA